MTKVSASTLARQAAKTKNPAKAKRLRAQAAQMRRDEREAKRFQSSTVSQLNQPKSIINHKDIVEAQQALNQMRAASVDSMSLGEQPGHGEIVGGYLARKAEEITKIARKKGGIDGVQMILRGMQYTARTEAIDDTHRRIQETAKQSNEQWRTNIVAGFIARCDATESAGRGLPEAMIVDGVTLARVIDALKAAGYTSAGKR